MRSPAWRALALLTLTAVAVSMATDAGAARRSSLAGNQFINDADDMFAFPQLLLKYKNSVIIDYAPYSYSGANPLAGQTGSSTSEFFGNASLTFGDETVWQFNTGRADYLINTAWWAWGGFDRGELGGFPAPSGLAPFPYNGVPGLNGDAGSPVQWWDLGVSRELGGNPWGLMISWANSSSETKTDGTVTTTSSTSMFSLQLGTTLGGVELAGEIGFGSAKTESGSPLAETGKNGYTQYSLLARGDITGGYISWRWIAALAGGSTSRDVPTGQENLSTLGLRGSFGPVFGNPGDWEVAGYLTVEYLSTDTPESSPYTKLENTLFTIPGYNIAMEYYLNSWFVVRGGAKSQYIMFSEKEVLEEGQTGTIDEDSQNVFLFFWSAGVGVDKESWGIDLALDEQNLHSGYVVGNGDQSGDTIGWLSAWLRW